MNDTQKRIIELSNKDIVRLSLWIFDEVREKIGGDLAEATIKELDSDEIKTEFNLFLNELHLPPIPEDLNSEVIANIFRTALIEFAEEYADIIEKVMDGLGVEAGWGTELAELIQGIGLSNLILILVVLKLNFRLDATIFQLDRKKGQIIETR